MIRAPCGSGGMQEQLQPPLLSFPPSTTSVLLFLLILYAENLLLSIGYSLSDKCLSVCLPVCLAVWISAYSVLHTLSMSFRRLPQLLLLRPDGKGKIGKSIVRARKRKKAAEDTQKKKKQMKAKKIMVLKRHNGGKELHQMFFWPCSYFKGAC